MRSEIFDMNSILMRVLLVVLCVCVCVCDTLYRKLKGFVSSISIVISVMQLPVISDNIYLGKIAAFILDHIFPIMNF